MKIKNGIDIQVLEIPGKGTETRILRNDFGDFDLEFNAKCRIYNKFGNPDPAHALSWVVDKTSARIKISTEIDGDDNTKLNGAFIQILASGGNSTEGRRLYEKTISFISQFTMFLCSNNFFEAVPADAKEFLGNSNIKINLIVEMNSLVAFHFLNLKMIQSREKIKEDRIIDAYTLYILNAFTNPGMNIPESIKKSG